VTQCHYNALFFEGSHYEFLNLSRRLRAGESVSPDMVATAIGGLWKFDRELAPLLPFLAAQVGTGRLHLGGIDDQLGGLGQTYANDAMPADLTAFLDGPRRAECREALRRRIYSESANDAPERARLQSCLGEIGAAVVRSRALDRPARAELLEMIASAGRFLTRATSDMAVYSQDRDRSMYLNFRWLADRLPPRSRIIVWAATSHIAKYGTPTISYARARNFGAYIYEAYGRRAFALGFTALGGAHFWTRQERSRPIPAALPGSLEALAMAGGGADAVYLGPRRLAALGEVPGSLFLHQPVTTQWSWEVDGVVIFREMQPPHRTD
jgi:erythromycin esterase-like protein